ncbi:MAG: hypothetical protein KAS93_03785 [Gammaproteobacteria bacterium]|nr:hypothetical protein [Gammaproteobacteria bacterium]
MESDSLSVFAQECLVYALVASEVIGLSMCPYMVADIEKVADAVFATVQG